MARSENVDVKVNRRPTMQEFEKYVIQQTIEGAEVVIYWEQLGLQLGESQNILDRIKSNCHDIESCCKEVFKKWLAKSPAATWNDIIKALNETNLHTAANELKKSLMKKKSTEKESLSMPATVLEPHGISNLGTLPLDFSKEDDIQVAFRKLTWEVIVQLKCIPAKRVSRECYSYFRCFYKTEQSPLFLQSLKEAATVEDLFYLIDDSPFYNFFNLKLLVHLAKLFDLKDLLSLINSFKSVYSSIPFKKILSLPGIQRFSVEGDKNIDLVTVEVKLKDSNITYGYVVENFVSSLSDQVLKVDVGAVLPCGFFDGSIIIKFLIPSYLKKCAIQSAFCSMQALSMLKVVLIEIDSYRIKCSSKNTDESPIQILCKSYYFLVKNLKPVIANEILVRKKLLHPSDIENIDIAPSQYAKNLIILEHLRCVDVPSLFVFCYELKKNDEQQYVGSLILNALESAGFSVIDVPHDQQLMCYDSLATTPMQEDKFKCLRHRRQSLSHNSDSHQLSFMDLIDQLCEILESNVPDATEILKRKCSELSASVSRRIKLFTPGHLKCLYQCIHVIMLLRALSPYLTWYSHSILSVLVESCNNPEASELLNNFNAKFSDTQLITKSEIPVPSYVMLPDDNSSYTILTTKINTNTFAVSLKYINEVKYTMTDKFKITEHSFQFLAMNKDPFIFYWIILKAIVPMICAQMYQCQEHFKEKGLTEICIYPSTVFKIDGCVKLGSLVYLENQFSEKWDDTVKSQLSSIEMLPGLLVNCNQELSVIKKMQDDDKDQRILILNERVAQLEKELTESRGCATSYYKENSLLIKRCSDLKESLMAQFEKNQNLEYSLYECASKQEYIKENKTTQTDMHEGMQLAWTPKQKISTPGTIQDASVIERMDNYDLLLTLDDIRNSEKARKLKPTSLFIKRLFIDKYAKSWMNIGLELGMHDTELNLIGVDYQNVEQDCCMTMLSQWLQKDPKATWEKLFYVVDSVADFGYTEGMNILKSKYLQIRFLSDKYSWPPLYNTTYVNLACTVYHTISTEEPTQLKQVTLSTTSKMVITEMLIHEIFMPTEKSTVQFPKRILIEGNPGIGKTTLVKEICYQWAKGILLPSDKLVLLLVSRDPSVQSITCLMELVQYFFPPTMKLNSVVKNLQNSKYQNQITIIIDGFDELSLALQQKSFLRDIIEGKVLTQAKVLITSRPFASATLHHYVDKRIEIIGFDANSRQQYIYEILKDKPDHLKQLQRHFQTYPNIDTLCYNPLFLSIVVFMCLLESLPSTATEMFNDFILHSINHHLRKLGVLPSKSIIFNSIEKFPTAVLETLKMLEKLAFTGLSEDKIVFTLADLPALCKDDPSCYGLLKLNECYTAYEMHHPTLSFCFLHLEVQEYLAARYVVGLSSKETNSLLEDSFLPQDEELLFSDDPSSVNNYRSSHIRFANMWIYYIGLVGTKNLIEHFLCKYGSSDLKERTSFVMESHFNPVAKDIFRSPVNTLFLFRCFQEAKDSEKHMLISGYFSDSIILTGYKLQPYQLTSLGCFLSESTKELEELNLYNCEIQDHGGTILHYYLAYSEVTIKKVNLCYNNLTATSSSHIGGLITSTKANCVLLSNNIINIDDITNATSKANFLKELWLMETGITKNTARSVAELLDIGLVELYISRNQLGDEGADILSHAVCKSTKLKVLDVSNNDIKVEGTKSMALALQNSKSLNTLWIGGNAVGHEGAEAIANALLHSTSVKELLLNGDETINAELALLLLHRAIDNNSVVLLCLPSMLSDHDQNMLKSVLHKVNSEPPRNFAPLQLDFMK